ncbi:hypothetical protein [Novosphingobium sp. 9U]|uniref:hypothetical protein n=1 Tax=Novosphingobium sp. 9U TaxID=2653158 RepID=UPI00135757F5|nr:hypothetical protein [Novosphingobium sp. 9U]
MMRLIAPCLAILIVGACGKADHPAIERIEMRRSGWVAEDVTISSAGSGTYHINEPPLAARSGTFKMTHRQFLRFLATLEPYRAEAETYSDQSAWRFIRGTCPSEVPKTTDMGAMYIRWKGPRYDAHFLMDFGCDARRNAARNTRMHKIFEQLPLPRP